MPQNVSVFLKNKCDQFKSKTKTDYMAYLAPPLHHFRAAFSQLSCLFWTSVLTNYEHIRGIRSNRLHKITTDIRLANESTLSIWIDSFRISLAQLKLIKTIHKKSIIRKRKFKQVVGFAVVHHGVCVDLMQLVFKVPSGRNNLLQHHFKHLWWHASSVR